MKHEHGRGKIKDNALAALVTSSLYKTKVEKAKKGKGSFTRKDKHKGRIGSWGSAVKHLLNRMF